MYVQIKNENYGYSTATFGDYVAIGNPGLVRYNAASSSVYWSGSIDLFQYNYNLDIHELVGTLYKDSVLQEVLLAQEITGSSVTALRTEPSGSDFTREKDIQIDKLAYTKMAEDGYGLALDIYDDVLVVGCPYYRQHVQTSASLNSISGSSVDIFDMNKFKRDALNTVLIIDQTAMISLGTGSYSGYFKVYTNDAPAGYDIVEVLFSDDVSGPFEQVISREVSPSGGGYIEYYFHPTSLPSTSGFFYKHLLFPIRLIQCFFAKT